MTKSPAWMFVMVSAVLPLQGCHRVTQKELQEKIIGTWDEVRGTNEMLEFHDDGTVLMQSAKTNQTCKYGFPDSKHLRLDCAPPGLPPQPQLWKLEFKDDHLLISDQFEVGTYQRR